MGTDKSNVIEIRKGKEHELCYKQDITNPNTLMYPAYVDARAALRGIVSSNSRWHNSQKNDGNKMDKSSGLYGYDSNIMIFSAERGQGKTSAMLSFTRKLVSETTPGSSNNIHPERKSFFSREKQEGNRFYVLPPIDPTMLGSSENIVCVVLSRLYQEINDTWKSSNHNCNTRVQNGRIDSYKSGESEWLDILEKIQKCYDWLDLNNDKDTNSSGRRADLNKDEFDDMLLLGDAFAIKEIICDIINFFFKLKGEDWPAENCFLVVQLDDTDMQFKNTYSVLEDVRKYLTIPNLIVMMAGNLDQLRDIIKQYYKDSCKVFSSERSEYMTDNYLDKLIPISQRVYLPTMKQQREAEGRLEIHIIDGDDDDNVHPKDLEIEFFKEIYDRTGIVFLKGTHRLHSLIPTSLRGMQELFCLLQNMTIPHEMMDNLESKLVSQEINYADQAYMKKCLSDQMDNIRIFERYFMYDWCHSKLNTSYLNILCGIGEIPQSERFQYVWDSIQGNLINVYSSQPESFSYISNVFDHDYTSEQSDRPAESDQPEQQGQPERSAQPEQSGQIEIKGYVEFLRKLASGSHKFTADQDYDFVFAIRTYFTIQLLKTSVSDEIDSVDKWDKERSFYSYSYNELAVAYTVDESRKYKKKDIIDSYKIFGDDLAAYLSGESKNSKGMALDEFSLLGDLIDLFFSDFRYNGPRKKSFQKIVLDLQRQLVYICFDWDIQELFIAVLSELRNEYISSIASISSSSHTYTYAFSFPMFSRFFGKFCDYFYDRFYDPKLFGGNRLLSIEPFHALDCIAYPVDKSKKKPYNKHKGKS